MKTEQKIDKTESELIRNNENSKSEAFLENVKIGASSISRPYIFVKAGKSYKRIPYQDIQYLKASGAYCDIVLAERSHTISASLNKVLEQLDTDVIIRCHRSFAVNIDMISSFDEATIMLGDQRERITLPISMTYRSEIMDVLPRLKSC